MAADRGIGRTVRGSPGGGELRRVITRLDLVLLVLGSVIGSGIFLVPGGVLTQTQGYVGPALLVWLLGGVLSLLGALTYGELASRNPGTGGIYLYIRDAFGPFPAFLYGWTLFIAMAAGSVATLAVAAAAYIGQFVPLDPTGRKAVALAMVAAVAWLNVRGTRVSVRVLDGATGLKVGALVFLIVALPLAGSGPSAPWWPEAWRWSLLQGAGLGMVAVLWAYEGWQFATYVAGEVIHPRRDFAGGLVLGTTLLVFIYVLANVAYVAALGPAAVATSERVASEAVAATFGRGLAGVMAVAVIVSMVSAAHSTILTASRVFFAMARDGVFFTRLARVHPRYGTPAFAVGAGAAIAGLLTLLGTFQQLLSYVVFVGWIFYGLGGASVFVFRRRDPDRSPPFRVPGYPLTPVLFVLAATGIVANAMISQPRRQTLLALSAVALGVPAYLLWRARRVTAG
jgi:APA family basic amino acid/polyamine antiporter